MPTLFTIGFTRTSAEQFFARLRTAGVAQLIDVRLNNGSQLAGFAKRDDLAYFLASILAISYRHETALAPTAELLAAYRETRDWPAYAREYAKLLASRKVETLAPVDRACLLCSEHTAEHCHRRLVAEYLAPHWDDARIVHL